MQYLLLRFNGLGHFEFKTLFLPRSCYKNDCRRTSKSRERLQEPSKDHQGQVSTIAARLSSACGNCFKGPQSATCGGVACTSPYTPRAMLWSCVRAPCQKGAQTGCWLGQYQLDGVKLACARSKSSTPKTSPKRHVCAK